ncbi:paraquat-inducible protein A [Paracoccus pacificus]|uniref:Paraquat-inducible protein A n=1 Tax=Paracoccus pacificus TaxID=1463598 RepID=A0ABW4R342_9RHOB
MKATPSPDLKTGAGLIACPRCDALYVEEELADGEKANCARCGKLLANPREGAFVQIIALSFTTMVLMVAAVFFPFLQIGRMGISNETSIFGVAMAFSNGVLLPLTLAVLAMIVGLPVIRAALVVYTLWPLARGRRPWRHAAVAFRMSQSMKPWSMAEVFVIGTSVALVKIGGLATVSLGPAFWAFSAMILVVITSDTFTSAATVWDAIEDATGQTGEELIDRDMPELNAERQ